MTIFWHLRMPMNCTQLLLFIKINLCSQRLCNASLHSIRVKFSAFFSFIGIDAPAFDLWHNSKPLKKYWFCPIFFLILPQTVFFHHFFRLKGNVSSKSFMKFFLVKTSEKRFIKLSKRWLATWLSESKAKSIYIIYFHLFSIFLRSWCFCDNESKID